MATPKEQHDARSRARTVGSANHRTPPADAMPTRRRDVEPVRDDERMRDPGDARGGDQTPVGDPPRDTR